MNTRFTIDGNDLLEKHLAASCREVSKSVQLLLPRDKLQALVLAGGYGRGEGGVLRTAAGDQPYNDLEFYVFTRGSRLLNEYRTPANSVWKPRSEAPTRPPDAPLLDALIAEKSDNTDDTAWLSVAVTIESLDRFRLETYSGREIANRSMASVVRPMW